MDPFSSNEYFNKWKQPVWWPPKPYRYFIKFPFHPKQVSFLQFSCNCWHQKMITRRNNTIWLPAKTSVVVERCWLKGIGGTVWADCLGRMVVVDRCWWIGVGGLVLVDRCWWIGGGENFQKFSEIFKLSLSIHSSFNYLWKEKSSFD